jgi:hypothetical protein
MLLLVGVACVRLVGCKRSQRHAAFAIEVVQDPNQARSASNQRKHVQNAVFPPGSLALDASVITV